MAAIRAKLDRNRAARLARWARLRRMTKSQVIRELVDRARPIETGEDMAEWVTTSAGKGLALAPKRP